MNRITMKELQERLVSRDCQHAHPMNPFAPKAGSCSRCIELHMSMFLGEDEMERLRSEDEPPELLLLEELNEMAVKATMCAESTLPGRKMRSLIYTALSYISKSNALKQIADQNEELLEEIYMAGDGLPQNGEKIGAARRYLSMPEQIRRLRQSNETREETIKLVERILKGEDIVLLEVVNSIPYKSVCIEAKALRERADLQEKLLTEVTRLVGDLRPGLVEKVPDVFNRAKERNIGQDPEDFKRDEPSRTTFTG